MGLDSQKHYAVDSDFRALCDYIFFKSQGIFSLPREYHWLYGFYNPLWLQGMSAKEFAVISRRGSVGYGINAMVKWHKREREHLLQALGITVNQV
jgi:hypothetical protein